MDIHTTFSTVCSTIGTSFDLYVEKIVEAFDYFNVSDDKSFVNWLTFVDTKTSTV